MHDTDAAATPTSPGPGQPPAQSRTLVCTANLLSFEPGLYAVEFRADAEIQSDIGLSIPCARLEPVTLPGNAARASVVSSSADCWLTRQTSSASLLVVGERLGAVLTVYRYSDQLPAPEVQFHQVYAPPVGQIGARSPIQPEATHMAGMPVNALSEIALPTRAASPGGITLPDSILLTVHHAGGAVATGADGNWAGDLVDAIEGFSISMPDGLRACDLEYQAILGVSWRTPWFPAGTFCGSRGMGLPLLGFRVRLASSAADRFEYRIWGRFKTGTIVGPIEGGQDCVAESNPLTGMRVQVWPKPAPEAVAIAGDR